MDLKRFNVFSSSAEAPVSSTEISDSQRIKDGALPRKTNQRVRLLSSAAAAAALNIVGATSGCKPNPQDTQQSSIDAESNQERNAADSGLEDQNSASEMKLPFLEAARSYVTSPEIFEDLLDGQEKETKKSLRDYAEVAFNAAFEDKKNQRALNLIRLTFQPNGYPVWVLKDDFKRKDYREDFHIIAGKYRNIPNREPLFNDATLRITIDGISSDRSTLEDNFEAKTDAFGRKFFFVSDPKNQTFYVYISKAAEEKPSASPRLIALEVGRKDNGTQIKDGLVEVFLKK